MSSTVFSIGETLWFSTMLLCNFRNERMRSAPSTQANGLVGDTGIFEMAHYNFNWIAVNENPWHVWNDPRKCSDIADSDALNLVKDSLFSNVAGTAH
jgi:hypothetical protein